MTVVEMVAAYCLACPDDPAVIRFRQLIDELKDAVEEELP